MILFIIHSQDGEGGGIGGTPWERGCPLVREENLHTQIHLHQTLTHDDGTLAEWVRRWRKIGGCSQKLALSDVYWISRWCNHGWGSAMPAPPTCISVWLKWNPRLQVSTMRQQLIQLTSMTASFWLWPPILRQHLIHRYPRLQVPPHPPPLQHPAAASSTTASNLLGATKKLSYGSSLVLCSLFMATGQEHHVWILISHQLTSTNMTD